VVTSGFLLCWAGAIFAENRSVLLVTFFVLAGLLVIVGARAFALVFKPSSIFRLYQQVSQKAPAYVSKTLREKGYREPHLQDDEANFRNTEAIYKGC